MQSPTHLLMGRAPEKINVVNVSKWSGRRGAIKWDEASSDHCIRDPRAAIPGTKMVFAGIKNDTEINGLAAFLKRSRLRIISAIAAVHQPTESWPQGGYG